MMLDNKLILIKSISLVFCESKTLRMKGQSAPLIKSVVSKLKLPDHMMETDTGRNAILGLRDTLGWMLENPTETFDAVSLLQRIKLNIGDDDHIYEVAQSIEVYDKLNMDELMSTACSLNKEIGQLHGKMSIRDIIYTAHRDLFYNKKMIDWNDYVNDLVADLGTHTGAMSQDQKSFLLDVMDMNDPEAMAVILEAAKDDIEGVGGFRTGWQAMNRMLGPSGQMRRGMFVLVGALTHNYKSGLCADLFRHFATLNEPLLKDPTKKPLLLYFSSENRAQEDLMRMYVALKEEETRVAVNISTVNSKEAALYVSQRLTERGFEVAMFRVDGGAINYTKLTQLILQYEADGYEVQAVVFDYLSLIDKSDLGSKSMIGEDVRYLMEKTRTFMSARDILFVTPHQLSQEAMSLKRSGVKSFISEIAGKNYWDGSKRIANEADLEIFLDIVKRDGRSYLDIHRGKYRTVKAPPIATHHFILPFSDIAYIPMDIHGEDSSLTTLVSDMASESIVWG